jgi:hypothetical protein
MAMTTPPAPAEPPRGRALASEPPLPDAPPLTSVPVPLDAPWWSKAQAAAWTPERLAAAEAAQQRTAEAVEFIGLYLSETPEQRRRRLRDEGDAAYAAAGETARERTRRHRAEDRQHQRTAQRAASLPWRQQHTERVRRFRRWCTLTALSASAGFSLGLVQWVATLNLPLGVSVWVAAWVLDLRIRGWGSTPVSQVHGGGRIAVLVVARIPVASALAAVCGLSPLLAATGYLLHHH